VQQLKRNWVRRVAGWPRTIVLSVLAWLRNRYDRLKKRYGRGYTHAMFVVTIVAFFSPMPGTTLAGIALVVLIAEIHRAISRRRKNRAAAAPEHSVMPINVEIIVDQSATPKQLRAQGSALWGWCSRTNKNAGLYQYLDSQVLADLIAGQLPSTGQTPQQFEYEADGIHLNFRDDESQDRPQAVASWRRNLPTRGVLNIMVTDVS
jgi:hypothetical protein